MRKFMLIMATLCVAAGSFANDIAHDLYDSALCGAVEVSSADSNGGYQKENMVDGVWREDGAGYGNYWYSGVSEPHWTYLDWSAVGRTVDTINSVTLHMYGGQFNAQDFTFQRFTGTDKSLDSHWTTVDTVIGYGEDASLANGASKYTYTGDFSSQAVRLHVTNASNYDTIARLAGLEVQGSYDFTGNIASLATAVAGSEDGVGYAATRVNDEDYATRWDSGASASGEWVYLDWGVGNTVSLDEVVLHTVGGSKERYSPENVEIQTYDGTGDLALDENWTTVDTLADFGDDPFAVFEFAMALETRALRVNSGSDGETDFVRYWEIEVFAPVPATATHFLLLN